MSAIRGIKNLLSIADELEEDLSDLNREVATNLITILALKTPKKTGEATGEWQVNINRKATTPTRRKDLNGSKTALIGIREINSSKNKKYPQIWISNLADHIMDLNEGSSAQAPRKFIELAEREALASVKFFDKKRRRR